MYLIIDKTTRAILHMSNAMPGEDKSPQDLLPGYDAKTMVFGVAAQPFIPARFDIVDGVVVDLDPAPMTAAAESRPDTLAQLRKRKLQQLSGQAMAERQTLVPDYQLLNAGLGLYDDARLQSLRATVNAFRTEMQRLQAAVAKARSAKELDALVPAFPIALVPAAKAPATKPTTTAAAAAKPK